MDWVKAKNAATLAELGKSPLYAPTFERTKKILDSKDKIAYPTIMNDRIYNFWKDADHQRGLWRRTTQSDYLTGNPTWETVLDIDALAKEENTPWAFGGADCLEPENRLCLVNLSRGGSDATEVREFDVKAKQWVPDGFKLREAKTSTGWVDAQTVLVGTDFGPGSMTSSGYARQVKLWKRGTPIASAELVLEIPTTDMGLFAFAYDAGGRKYFRVSHQKNFYESTQYLFEKGKLVKIDVPIDADTYLLRTSPAGVRADAVGRRRPEMEHGRAHRHAGGRFSRRQERIPSRHRARSAREHQRRQRHPRLRARECPEQREGRASAISIRQRRVDVREGQGAGDGNGRCRRHLALLERLLLHLHVVHSADDPVLRGREGCPEGSEAAAGDVGLERDEGRPVRGHVEGRHQDSILRRQPRGPAERRHESDAAATRTAASRSPIPLRTRPRSARPGWSAAASTCSRTSAAAASSARSGTAPD